MSGIGLQSLFAVVLVNAKTARHAPPQAAVVEADKAEVQTPHGVDPLTRGCSAR